MVNILFIVFHLHRKYLLDTFAVVPVFVAEARQTWTVHRDNDPMYTIVMLVKLSLGTHALFPVHVTRMYLPKGDTFNILFTIRC